MKTRLIQSADLFFCGLLALAGGCADSPVAPPCCSPVVDAIPDQAILQDQTFQPINLKDFVSDTDDPDSVLIWSCSNNVDLTVEFTSGVTNVNRPDLDWTGSETIYFRVTDPGGLWDEDTVTFRVDSVSYMPADLGDLPVSVPAQQGLDSRLVYRTYQIADTIPHLYSLLILKNGYLVAEKYFHFMRASTATASASVTKSYISALTGIALRDGYLDSIDQRMSEFFPEFDWSTMDPRKSEITIRHILQMRSGYPWEQQTPPFLNILFTSNLDWIRFIDDFPLLSDPGTQFGYSNFTAHMMAIILARATGTPLASYAQDNLFDHLGYHRSGWPRDAYGYYVGHGDMRIKPRDMAKLGLTYLNNGVYNGVQVIPAEWVSESFTAYSFNVYGGRILDYVADLDYGYLWWKAEAGGHEFNFAWGHGGQLIVIVRGLDLVVIATADNLVGDTSEDGWLKEKAVLDMATGFIASCSGE